jgi:hypothetical protein
MALHHDVTPELKLLPDCPGVLPLDAERVRSVYASLGLIYSVPSALRVLAETVDVSERSVDVTDPPISWSPRPQRFPRLTPRVTAPIVPAVEQLSLFA